MASGISFGIGADTRDFASGVKKGLIEPLEETKKVLEDVAREGDDATSKLESSFRDQQRATVDNARTYKQMSDDIRQASRRTTSDVGQDSRQMAHESNEAVDEIHDSLRSNAIETAASFDGSFEGISGGLQGLLSEFLVGFGPAGIIAGLAAAGGLGLLTTAIEGSTEAAETQKAEIAALAGEYIAVGRTGKRSFDSISTAIQDMATAQPEDVIITLGEAWEDARKSGADYQQVIEAVASRNPRLIAEAREALEKFNLEQQRAARGATDLGGVQAAAADQAAAGAGRLDLALQKAEKQAREAGRAQVLAAKAGLSDFQLKADLLKQVEDAYDDTAEASDDYFDKEKTAFKVGAYIAAMDKRRDALVKYKDALSSIDLSPEAKKFLESQGADAAALMVAGYQKASPKQKAQLSEIWSTAGAENATSYGDALGKKIDTVKVPKLDIPVPVIPAPNTSALDRYFRQPHVVRVVVDAQTRNGVRIPG